MGETGHTGGACLLNVPGMPSGTGGVKTEMLLRGSSSEKGARVVVACRRLPRQMDTGGKILTGTLAVEMQILEMQLFIFLLEGLGSNTGWLRSYCLSCEIDVECPLQSLPPYNHLVLRGDCPHPFCLRAWILFPLLVRGIN